jgi:methyl-accepting chemotaxis protein
MVWAEAVTAVSTAIIAVMLLAAGILALSLLRDVRDLVRTAQRAIDTLERDARPALLAAKGITEDASKAVSAFKDEAGHVAKSVKDVRERFEVMIDRTEERLHDLDALIDVVHYEVEETALDIAAALRTTRRGATVVRAMKRAFLGKGR